MNAERFNLAQLVDWLALPEGPRDRALVLRTASWLHEHAHNLCLVDTPAAAWRDRVATLQVQDRVSLVVTGYVDGQPGEWTWKVAERDFPDVWMALVPEAVEDALVVAALDYDIAGRAVLLPTGDRAVAQCSVLTDGVQRVRVRLPTGATAMFARGDVEIGTG
ncbi:MAG: hypothetical protein FJ100_15980 [Deltaproteobacteria bacterium]|nr:hypothetical protein [Deltaproteobacteria bacterium]